MYTPVLAEPSPLPPVHGRRLQIAAAAAAVGGTSSCARGGSSGDPVLGSEPSPDAGIAVSDSAGGIVPRPARVGKKDRKKKVNDAGSRHTRVRDNTAPPPSRVAGRVPALTTNARILLPSNKAPVIAPYRWRCGRSSTRLSLVQGPSDGHLNHEPTGPRRGLLAPNSRGRYGGETNSVPRPWTHHRCGRLLPYPRNGLRFPGARRPQSTPLGRLYQDAAKSQGGYPATPRQEQER